MEFFGRLRHPVQQKDSTLVEQVISEILSEILIEVERLGFILTGGDESGIYFTAKTGKNINDSNILQKVVLAERYGNQSAKRLNVQFDFSQIPNN